jgi:hypothetical protein
MVIQGGMHMDFICGFSILCFDDVVEQKVLTLGSLVAH